MPVDELIRAGDELVLGLRRLSPGVEAATSLPPVHFDAAGVAACPALSLCPQSLEQLTGWIVHQKLIVRSVGGGDNQRPRIGRPQCGAGRSHQRHEYSEKAANLHSYSPEQMNFGVRSKPRNRRR